MMGKPVDFDPEVYRKRIRGGEDLKSPGRKAYEERVAEAYQKAQEEQRELEARRIRLQEEQAGKIRWLWDNSATKDEVERQAGMTRQLREKVEALARAKLQAAIISVIEITPCGSRREAELLCKDLQTQGRSAVVVGKRVYFVVEYVR